MHPDLSLPHRVHRFDGFELDPKNGVLLRDGEGIPIQELPFQILVALLEHPGEIVTREELRNRLWPSNVHVDFEASIATALKKLRRALGDTSQHPRFVETHPGRGLRFLGKVNTHSANSAACRLEGIPPLPQPMGRVIPFRRTAEVARPGEVSSWRPHPWVIWTGLLTLLAVGSLMMSEPWRQRPGPTARAPVASVLALPARFHGKAQNTYLAEVVPAILSTLLAAIPELETKVPPSTFEVEKAHWDLERIAKAYQVRHMVLSTITAGHDRIRLNIQLVDAASRQIRWARHYEGSVEDFPALASQAVESMLPTLRPGGEPAGFPPSPPGVLKAEIAMEEGRYYLNRYGTHHQPGSARRCQDALKKALGMDPTLARAAGNLAYLRVFQSWYEPSPARRRRALAECTTWAHRALAIDPSCGVAWEALAQVEAQRSPMDLGRFLEYALKGASNAPCEAMSHQALGRASGSATLMAAVGRHMFELDPFDTSNAAMGAIGLMRDGKATEGLQLIDAALRLGPPENSRFALTARALALTQLGRFEEAAAELARYVPEGREQNWEDNLWRQTRFQLAVIQGEQPLSATLAHQIVARALAPPSSGPGNAFFIAVPSLVRAGFQEEAMRILLKHAELGCGEDANHLLRDPTLQPLRRDPRFARVLKAAREANAITVSALEGAQARGELPAYLAPALAELRAERARTH